jgi:hypothetical protein
MCGEAHGEGSRSRNGRLGGRSGGSDSRLAFGEPEGGTSREVSRENNLSPAFGRDGLRTGTTGQSRRGEGRPNPRDVSGRNTPQGSRRRKPSRSWETAKADRSGCGSPRRGDSSQARLRPYPGGITGKWIPRAGSVGGAENSTGGGTSRQVSHRRKTCLHGPRSEKRTSRANERPRAVLTRKGNQPGGGSTEDARVQVARREGRRRFREARRADTPSRQTLKVIVPPGSVLAARYSGRNGARPSARGPKRT